MNLLIVDDEAVIIQGLCDLIKELSVPDENLEIVGASSSSLEALNLLSSKDVDVVLTDIRMPGMDGLSLSSTIRHRHPDVHIVFVTGFHDFVYMKEALRLKADDYLVKPIKKDSLQDTLTRIHQMSMKKKKNERFLSGQQFAEHSFPYKVLIACDLDEGNAERIEKLGSPDLVLWLYRKTLLEVIDEQHQVFFITPYTKIDSFNMVLGISACSRNEAIERSRQAAEVINHFWKSTLKLSASLGISSVFENGESYAVMEMQACLSLMQRIYKESDIFSFQDASPPHFQKKEFDLLLATIEVSDYQKLIHEMNRVIEEIIRKGEISVIPSSLEALLYTLYKQFKFNLAGKDQLFAQKIIEIVKKLFWSRTKDQLSNLILEELKQWFELCINDLVFHDTLQRAKDYCSHHYHQPISLADAAKAAFVSPSHLSRLFRKEEDMTFLEFLTQLRVNEAKRLLSEHTDIKIYELAERVGYQDWKYFSRIFKELTGYTPKCFQEKCDSLRKLH